MDINIISINSLFIKINIKGKMLLCSLVYKILKRHPSHFYSSVSFKTILLSQDHLSNHSSILKLAQGDFKFKNKIYSLSGNKIRSSQEIKLQGGWFDIREVKK